MGKHFSAGNRTTVVSLRFHPEELAAARVNAAQHGAQLPEFLRLKAQEFYIPDVRTSKPLPPLAALKKLEAANAGINTFNAVLLGISSLRSEDEQHIRAKLIEIQQHIHEADRLLRSG